MVILPVWLAPSTWIVTRIVAAGGLDRPQFFSEEAKEPARYCATGTGRPGLPFGPARIVRWKMPPALLLKMSQTTEIVFFRLASTAP